MFLVRRLDLLRLGLIVSGIDVAPTFQLRLHGPYATFHFLEPLGSE